MFPVYLCVYQAWLKLLSEIDLGTFLGCYRLCLTECIESVCPCRCQPFWLAVQADKSNHSEEVSGRISTNNLIQV